MANGDDHNVGTVFTVPSFPIKTSVVLVLLALAWIVLYYFVPIAWKPIVGLGGAAAAGVGALLGAYYAGQMLQTQIRQHNRELDQRKSDHEREQKREALRYSSRWNDPNIFHAQVICKKVIGLGSGPTGANDVKEYLSNDDNDDSGKLIKSAHDKQVNMGQVLNFFEEFSIAVLTEVADEKLARRLFRGTLMLVCDATREWRIAERALRKTPRLWIEMDTLNSKWQS